MRQYEILWLYIGRISTKDGGWKDECAATISFLLPCLSVVEVPARASFLQLVVPMGPVLAPHGSPLSSRASSRLLVITYELIIWSLFHYPAWTHLSIVHGNPLLRLKFFCTPNVTAVVTENLREPVRWDNLQEWVEFGSDADLELHSHIRRREMAF